MVSFVILFYNGCQEVKEGGERLDMTGAFPPILTPTHPLQSPPSLPLCFAALGRNFFGS